MFDPLDPHKEIIDLAETNHTYKLPPSLGFLPGNPPKHHTPLPLVAMTEP